MASDPVVQSLLLPGGQNQRGTLSRRSNKKMTVLKGAEPETDKIYVPPCSICQDNP